MYNEYHIIEESYDVRIIRNPWWKRLLFSRDRWKIARIPPAVILSYYDCRADHNIVINEESIGIDFKMKVSKCRLVDSNLVIEENVKGDFALHQCSIIDSSICFSGSSNPISTKTKV